ncbi:MAG: hypothetical protein JRD89_04390 [Deltaproteobacteria bacterium]|nr:hypothetical protein [Deltaproteobacteria bacterium]
MAETIESGGERLEKGEVVEVRCFGVPDDKVRNIRTRTTAEIFNDKLGIWQRVVLVDYYDDCPVCRRRMHVLAVEGTTWFACCSAECYKKVEEKAKELGGLHEALGYFRRKFEGGVNG